MKSAPISLKEIFRGLTEGEIRFLEIEWSKKGSFDHLYDVFCIKKKSGGTRRIEAPHKVLKKLQKLTSIYLDKKISYHKSCHGFRKGHSTKTNSIDHVNNEIVINIDIKNFFHSICSSRIHLYLNKFLNNEQNNFIVSALTRFERLPQGSPSSPLIANMCCYELDCTLSRMITAVNGNYTRYVDDITISGDYEIRRILPMVRQVLWCEGFALNEKKTRFQRKGRRQEVTGLVVNEKVSVPRYIRKKIRAAIHRKSKGRQPFWNGEELSDSSLKGHVDYVTSIHPEYKEKYSFIYTFLDLKSYESVDSSVFSPGMKVRHQRFGPGLIIDMKNGTRGPCAVIEFKDGIKTVLTDIAPMGLEKKL